MPSARSSSQIRDSSPEMSCHAWERALGELMTSAELITAMVLVFKSALGLKVGDAVFVSDRKAYRVDRVPPCEIQQIFRVDFDEGCFIDRPLAQMFGGKSGKTLPLIWQAPISLREIFKCL